MNEVDGLEVAKSQALKYVSARLRTKREVTDYLSKKGYENAVIHDVILFLEMVALFFRRGINSRPSLKNTSALMPM